MSFIIDVLLIAICVFIVILGTKRGFVKTLMSFLSTIVALICAYTFTPMFASFLKNNFFLAPVAESIEKTLQSLVPAEGSFDISSLLGDMPQTLVTILDRYQIDPEALVKSVESMPETGREAIGPLSEMIASPIVDMISTVVAFVSIFVIVSVVLAIVTLVINTVFKLPVLKGANTLLGFVLGFAIAVIVMFVYSSLVSTLVVSLGSISPKWFGSDVIEGTLIVKFLSENDFLSIVNNLLK